MDKLFAYLLLVLVVIACWNDTLSNRLQRLFGSESSKQQVAEEISASVAGQPATSKRTPFWQQPGYRSTLEPTKKSH